MSSSSRPISPAPLEDLDDDEPHQELHSSTRQISLVERLELNLPTSRLTPNSILLGDIDNDPTGVRTFLELWAY